MSQYSDFYQLTFKTVDSNRIDYLLPIQREQFLRRVCPVHWQKTKAFCKLDGAKNTGPLQKAIDTDEAHFYQSKHKDKRCYAFHYKGTYFVFATKVEQPRNAVYTTDKHMAYQDSLKGTTS
tara:strand:- start:232 stop:594 length:363 start_codon:yes stop_codon:yes gene_type:complete